MKLIKRIGQTGVYKSILDLFLKALERKKGIITHANLLFVVSLTLIMADELNDLEKGKLSKKNSKSGKTRNCCLVQTPRIQRKPEKRNKLRHEVFGMAKEFEAFH